MTPLDQLRTVFEQHKCQYLFCQKSFLCADLLTALASVSKEPCAKHPNNPLVCTECNTLRRPEPSRGELEKILSCYERLMYGPISEKCEHFPRHETSLIDALMTWAQGHPPQPVWCKHIRYQEASHPEEHYVFEDYGGIFMDKRGWKYCPVCRTPRPEAR